MPSTAASIRIGTSGWNYPHWRERFYPPKLPASRWFRFFADVFDTVEINNTFYRMPTPEVVDRWAAEAPDHFLFAVKANRVITHRRKLHNVEDVLEQFLELTSRLREHRGPILFQLPPRWRRNLERLDEFCGLLPSRGLFAFEFRDPDWLCRATFEVLRAHRVALCIHDMLPRHPRQITAGFVYVRFHGPDRAYGGSYTRSQLRRWSEWMRQVALEGRTVYAYFNNDAEAYAVQNALTLRELLVGEPSTPERRSEDGTAVASRRRRAPAKRRSLR